MLKNCFLIFIALLYAGCTNFYSYNFLDTKEKNIGMWKISCEMEYADFQIKSDEDRFKYNVALFISFDSTLDKSVVPFFNYSIKLDSVEIIVNENRIAYLITSKLNYFYDQNRRLHVESKDNIKFRFTEFGFDPNGGGFFNDTTYAKYGKDGRRKYSLYWRSTPADTNTTIDAEEFQIDSLQQIHDLASIPENAISAFYLYDVFVPENANIIRVHFVASIVNPREKKILDKIFFDEVLVQKKESKGVIGY